jgi:CRISPR/Cas system-associated exonuclease Cas4 (RecB family)
MLVLGEGFSKQAGPWLDWMERLLESGKQGVIEKARSGVAATVRFKNFSVKIVPASQLNGPQQLSFNVEPILVAEAVIPFVRTPRAISSVEMTPSELSSFSACSRFFHWTRILGQAEPGTSSAGDTPQMRLGSIAHKMMESATSPTSAALATAGLADLGAVFGSADWQSLTSAEPERELPFIMHFEVHGKDCWIRGRMDAVIPGNLPRVIDYKYATWREGAEADYEIQMSAYSLALMKALGTKQAVGELWYLKSPMKIVRREYTLMDAEAKLSALISRYLESVEKNEWPMAARAHCDRIECGFRTQCWEDPIPLPVSGERRSKL